MGEGGGRSLPSANPDNVAAGGATDARCGGEGERRGGMGQITAHGNPHSSFSLSFFPLCVQRGFDEKFCFRQCSTVANFPPISTIPAVNLPPVPLVSLISVKNQVKKFKTLMV